MSKKGSYIGGSTVVRVHQSNKRLAERQAHWRRKRGIDQIEQCVEGVGDPTEGPRLIKRGDVRQRPRLFKRPKRSAEQPQADNDVAGQHGRGQKKLKRKIHGWRIDPKTGKAITTSS